MAGPESGVTTPYVYWTVKDANGNLIGGATFQLQGPRTSNSNWGNTYTVTDCTSSPCTGLDRDPDPGEFQVANGQGGLGTMTTSQRWQVQPAPNQSTWTYGGVIYNFMGDTDWAQIAGNNNTPSAGQWTTNTHNFGSFVAAKRPTPTANAGLTCGINTFYSVTSTGQLRSVVNGTVTALKSASGVTVFNGLGIGSGGATAYAYERNNSDASITMWFYDATSGWTSTGDTFTTPTGNDNSYVTGAVDLKTGNYYFGGFSGTTFYLYKWVPSTGAFSAVGTVNMAGAAGGNGDMAFDAAGDLYIVNSGATTTVYSVTAATLAGASGGQLAASQSFSKTLSGLSDVNGMAFNTTGSMYLANSTTANEYDSTTWSKIGNTVTSSLGTSTDLASCNSPANLTVQKNVQGRVSPTDQFRLAVNSGSTESGYAVTSGSATGIQAAQVGPLPVMQGNTYTVSETMAPGSTSSSSAYASSLVCTSNGTTLSVTNGNVTIPNVSGAVVGCIFTNSPLVANVTINKQMQDSNGQNAQPRQGWTVGAAATATAGTVTSTSPSAATQPTDANGNAAWNVTFGSSNSAATVAVHEEQQAGYDFVSGSCTVTKLSGTTSTTQLTGSGAQSLTGVGPGDQVNCTYTNKPSATKLTLVKKVTNSHGGTAQPSAWTLTATGAVTTISGVTGTAAVTSATVQPGDYALSESGGPAGYVAGAWSCTGATANGSSVTLSQGANVTCTITNSDQPGSVTWTKTDNSGQALSGSQWTLTGPGAASGTTVTDCTQAPCSAGAFTDQDPAVGQFKLSNLTWGDYSLVESKAPVGYVLDTTKHTFTVGTGAGQVGVPGPTSIGTFTNTQATVPVLPLTGGMSTDAFILIGGGSLAAAGLGGWWNRRSMRKSRD